MVTIGLMAATLIILGPLLPQHAKRRFARELVQAVEAAP